MSAATAVRFTQEGASIVAVNISGRQEEAASAAGNG